MTTKERLFVSYYLGRAKGNGTLAATLAGYNHAAITAHRLLRKANISAAIEAKLDRVAMTEEEVLARISDRAASSAEDFIRFPTDAAADTLPSLDLTRARKRGQLGNLKKLKTRRTPGDNPQEITEVEIHDCLPALALLAKFHGLGERKEASGTARDVWEEAESVAADTGEGGDEGSADS